MMRGWLLKKGPKKNISVYKRRYFVLSRHTKKLNYYEDPSCKVLLGYCDLVEAVRLRETEVQEAGQFGIEVITVSRIWSFIAEDQTSKVQWMTALGHLVPPDTSRKGWCFHKQQVSGWKKRYFILNENGIPFYEEAECTNYVDSLEITSAVNLTRIQQPELENHYGFQVVCLSPFKVHQLYCETEKERENWIKSLTHFVTPLTSKTQPLHVGHLTKRGERVKNWKNRFFVLLEGVLLYFADADLWTTFLADEEARANGQRKPQFQSKAVSGAIPLRGAEVVLEESKEPEAPGEFLFYIKTHDRLYHLRATNDEERRKWVFAIQQCAVFAPFQSHLLLDPETAFLPDEEVEDEVEEEKTKPSLLLSGSIRKLDTADERQAMRAVPMFLPVWKQKLMETLTHPFLSQYFCRYYLDKWPGEVRLKQPKGAHLEIDPCSLAFWLQAEEYSLLTDSNYRKHLAVEIFQRFFAHGADAKIHVQSQLLEALSSRFANPFGVSYHFDNDLFRPCQEQVLEMLAADVFPYFLLSHSEYGFKAAIRAQYDDMISLSQRASLFTDIYIDEKRTPDDSKHVHILRNDPRLKRYITSLSTAATRAASEPANMYVSISSPFHKEEHRLASASIVRGTLDNGGGMYAYSLWKDLDEYEFLNPPFRHTRAYGIYEEYVCLCASRLVRIPEELLNQVIQNLVSPNSATFATLKAVIQAELIEHYVKPFLTSRLYKSSDVDPSQILAPLPQDIPAEYKDVDVPPFEEVMSRFQFRMFLTAKGWLKYWTAWRDMEDYRVLPYQETDSDKWSMQRTADFIFRQYFSSMCPNPVEVQVLNLTTEKVYALIRHARPYMFHSFQWRLQEYITNVLWPLYIASCKNDPSQIDTRREPDLPPKEEIPALKGGVDTIVPESKEPDPNDDDVLPPPPTEQPPPPPEVTEFDLPPPPDPPSRRCSTPPPPPDEESRSRQGSFVPPPPEDPPAVPTHKRGESVPPPPPASSPPVDIPDAVPEDKPFAPPTSVSDEGNEQQESTDSKGRTIVPFAVVLGDSKLSKYFKHYVSRSTSAGSLLFYFLVEEYSRLPMSNDAVMTAPAAAFRISIYKTFLGEAAPVKLSSIPEPVRVRIKDRLTGRPRPFIFNEAQALVFEDLRTRFYTAFRESSFYQQLLKEYKTDVVPRKLDGLRSYWSPARRTNPRSIDNLSCYNSSWTLFFKRFLDKTFCTENYLFFVAVDDFRYFQGHNFRQIHARRIFEKFISKKSKLEVNIPSPMYQQIVSKFEECPPNLFHRAQEEIFHLMKKDSLPRFLTSEEYKLYNPADDTASPKPRTSVGTSLPSLPPLSS